MKKSKVTGNKSKNGPQHKLESLPQWLKYNYEKSYQNWEITNFKTKLTETKIYFEDISKLFSNLEITSKKTQKITYLVEMFLSILHKSSSSLSDLTSLLSCELFPIYTNQVLNIGDALLQKSVSEVTNRKLAAVRASLKKTGDLGQTVADCKKNQTLILKPKPLFLKVLVEKLRKLPLMSGNKSQQDKLGIINGLLVSSSSIEAKYLVRILQGKPRLGLAERTIVTALAIAITIYSVKNNNKAKDLEEEKLKEKIRTNIKKMKRIVNETSYIPTAIDELVSNGYSFDGLKEHYIQTFIPFRSMLAEPSKSIEGITSKFDTGRFIAEEKFDGERAQIHFDGKLEIFSRNCETQTNKWLDVVHLFNELLFDKGETKIKENEMKDIKSFILDCEMVAINNERTKILPFQILSTRKRKIDNKDQVKVKVCVFVFDILFYNGESLFDVSLLDRKKMLKELTEKFDIKYNELYKKPIKGVLEFVDHELIKDITLECNIEKLQTCLDTAIKNCNEGLMLKMVDGNNGTYKPGKRAKEWRKLKKDYIKGVGDSFDLIPMGAYFGKGKRTGVYGGFLMGSLNDENGEIESVCKVGTGFTDDNLQSLFRKLEDHEIEKEPRNYMVNSTLKPDVYFREHDIVWEIEAADLSVSPVHLCSSRKVSAGSGIGLRFPRFIRVRDDKKQKDATTSDRVYECYLRQTEIFENQ